MPAVGVGTGGAMGSPGQSPASAVQAAAGSGPAQGSDKGARTVLGMAPVRPAELTKKQPEKPPMAVVSTNQPVPSTPPVRADQGQPGSQHKTMLGMAAMVGDYAKPTAQPEKPKVSNQVPTPAEAPRAIAAERTPGAAERTPGAAERTPGAAERTPAAADRVHSAKTDGPANREQKQAENQGSKDPVPEKKPATALSPGETTGPGDWTQDDEEGVKGQRGAGLLIAAIVAGVVVVVIGVIAVVYLAGLRGPGQLNSQIFPTADGRGVTVAFSFPDAPAGATIEVAGETVPVMQGQARLVIAMSSLKLGKNDVKAVYREPGKEPSERVLPIVLRHNVNTDFSGLLASPPYIMVSFQVAPEIGLALDGKQVPLSNGLYHHKMFLSDIMKSAEKSGDNLMLSLTFQLIDAAGQTEQGQQMIPIPITKLQIDRPADGAQVESDSITCAGMTEPGAEVTVNGQPVGVTSAGFNTIVPLPALGEHKLQIVAKVKGKAPRTHSVSVARIESLKAAIEEWSRDLDARLDYPKIGRNPNAHLNKKVKLSGRIVNISTERGVTAFLLYVADGCPPGARCAVYVVFRGETDAGLQSLVDVYGQVKGTRGVDLPSGSQLDVPAVEAKYVTKTVSSKRSQRRR